MILQLASPYIPVVVLALFWLLAMRPILRLIHLSPSGAHGRVRRARAPAAPRSRPARR